MNSPKISVIVAVYKAEKYIHRCVDSLLNQTFKDYEILLIDDGSPDSSGEICDEYAHKDNSIRVFHKENGGVSSARQYGIDHAQGKYTIHADPDDWVEPNMLEKLYEKAEAGNADMVICDYYSNFGEKQIMRKQQPTALDHQTVLHELFQQLHGSCWNKLVKRVCYSRYNITFPIEISFCEDLLVCVRLLKHDLKVAYLPMAFYHYTHDSNQLTKKHSDASLERDAQLYSLFEKEFDGNPPQYITDFFMVMKVKKMLIPVHPQYTSKEFQKEFQKYIPNIRRHSGISVIQKYLLILACCGFYKLAQSLYHIGKSLKFKQILINSEKQQSNATL